MTNNSKVLLINVSPDGYPFATIAPLLPEEITWDVALLSTVPKGKDYGNRQNKAKLFLPPKNNDYFAAIITGSSFTAYPVVKEDGSTYLAPWKQELIEWILWADSQGIGVFGDCFGAEILAMAFGGTVQKMNRLEFGWGLINLTKEGHEDFVSSSLSSPFVAGVNHEASVVALPKNAVLLAENSFGVQAFRVGKHVGVQFHPERTVAATNRLMANHPEKLKKAKVTLEEMLELEKLYDPCITNLFARFLNTL